MFDCTGSFARSTVNRHWDENKLRHKTAGKYSRLWVLRSRPEGSEVFEGSVGNVVAAVVATADE